MNTPELPKPVTQQVYCLLLPSDGHPEETLVADTDYRVWIDLGPCEYRELTTRDYSYRDLVAVCEKITTFLSFTGWWYISGGGSADRCPTWCSEDTYRLLRLWRVGQKGKLKELSRPG